MAEKQTQSHTGSAPQRVGPASFEARSREGESRSANDLHICPSCNSELVYPVDWAPANRRHWNVARRCPDCEWQGDGVHSQDVVDRFDEALDLGTEQFLDDLNMLARANMEEQVESFTAAIWADQILPEDF